MAYRCGIVGICPNPNIECKECEYYSEPLFDDEDDDEYWYCADGERKDGDRE